MALMEQIRNSTQSGLAYIMVGVLIVFFAVFFGVPADGCRAAAGRTLMANVAGEDIYSDDVNVIYNRYFGGSTTMDEELYFNQQAEALKIVLATHLLAERAEKAGLRVSDEEFVAYIQDPNRNIEFLNAYGRDGSFDGPFYERYVQHGLHVSLGSYEEFKRKELLARKYLTMMEMQVHVLPAEVEELYSLRNTRVNLEYVLFSDELLVDAMTISDEAVQDFLAENLARVQEVYEANQSDYSTDERVQLRRVYIIKASDEAEAAGARDKFDAAKKRILEDNEDFAAVVRELSEGFDAAEGGLMDWNALTNIDQEIAAAIEGAAVGEVREVETDYAFMLVKVEGREEAQITPLEDVQDEIASELIREEIVTTRGTELSETLLAKVQEGLSIDDALAALEEEAREEDRLEDASLWSNLSSRTTGFFTLEGQQLPPELRAQLGAAALSFGRSWDTIPGLGTNRDLAITAFKLTEENPLIDHIVEVDNGRAVVRLADREDPSEEISDEDREQLEMEIRLEKTSELIGPVDPLFGHILFVQPLQGVGSFVEGLVEDAVASGKVRLYERRSRGAALLREKLTSQDDDLDSLLGTL